MKIRLGGHWLAFLWTLAAGQGGSLKDSVSKAYSAGATVFELIFHALNQMSAKETAKAIKDGRMTRAIMCVFFPPGKDNDPPPFGDPLSDDKKLFDQAVEEFKKTIDFIVELRMFGIEINMIVGPSCWVLGKNYGLDDAELRKRVKKFYGEVAMDLAESGIRVAIELLREEEDCVAKNVEQLNAMVDELNRAYGEMFGIHYDTFHFDCRGYDQVTAIKAMGERIIHTHFNGTGRRPAGGEGDDIQWAPICEALSEIVKGDIVSTNEPFCALVRNEEPTLGNGLPDPVEEPGGIAQTAKTLSASGFLIEADDEKLPIATVS